MKSITQYQKIWKSLLPKTKKEYPNTYSDSVNALIDTVNRIITDVTISSIPFEKEHKILQELVTKILNVYTDKTSRSSKSYILEFGYYSCILLGMIELFYLKNTDIYNIPFDKTTPFLFGEIVHQKIMGCFSIEQGEEDLIYLSNKQKQYEQMLSIRDEKSRKYLMNILFQSIIDVLENNDGTYGIYENSVFYDEKEIDYNGILILPSDYYITWFWAVQTLKTSDNVHSRHIANLNSPDEIYNSGEKILDQLPFVIPNNINILSKDELKVDYTTANQYHQEGVKENTYKEFVIAFRKARYMVLQSVNGWVINSVFFSGLSKAEVQLLIREGMIKSEYDNLALTFTEKGWSFCTKK